MDRAAMIASDGGLDVNESEDSRSCSGGLLPAESYSFCIANATWPARMIAWKD